MPSRSGRWTWALLIAAAAGVGIFLVSVIGVGSKEVDVVIRVDRVPDESGHPRACEVVWQPETATFTDPCLGTVYDRTGLNVGGPAPRGLDAYPVKVSEREYVGKLVTVDLTKPKPVGSE
jgi:hypothetical protein